MLILDENIRLDQQPILKAWRIRTRKIGKDLAPSGTADSAIIPLLRRLPSPTFFTHDRDFWDRRLCDRRYCIVVLDVPDNLAAQFVRRALRQPSLNTKAKRTGKVVRIDTNGMDVFQAPKVRPEHLPLG